jgi:hypothetical protein
MLYASFGVLFYLKGMKICGRKRKYPNFIDISFVGSVFGRVKTACVRFLGAPRYLVGLRIKRQRRVGADE